MTASTVPRNAYTDSPEQHPSIILGSLQLLLWLFFRPSAWRNHLGRIDPTLLRSNSDRARRLRWQNFALWWLLIQGYLLLPLLANLPFNLVWLGLGESVATFAFRVVLGIVISTAFGLVIGIAISVAVGIVISLVASLAFSVAFDVAFIGALAIFGTIGCGVGISLFKGVPLEVIVSKIIRIGESLSFVVIPLLKVLRLVVICPLQTVGNYFLYQFDKRRSVSTPSLLRYHSAFWDAWHQQRLSGLDKHLILVMERNPDEGNAAIKYLSTRSQRWAAQAALLEMNTQRIATCRKTKLVN